MSYTVYQIRYETMSVAYPWGVVSAESDERAKSLLEKHVVEAFPRRGGEMNTAREIGFKVGEVRDSGVKADREKVILPLEGSYAAFTF